MDLSEITPQKDTVEVILTHPSNQETLFNKDGTEMSITVALPHSDVYKKALREQQEKRFAKAAKKGKQQFSAEDIEESTLNLLANTTVDWNITHKGETPKLTAGKAREIYKELFWVREQIDEEVNSTDVFMKN